MAGVKYYITFFLHLSLVQFVLSQQQKNNEAVAGIGFTTNRIQDKDGNSLLVSVWYPSAKAGQRMNLRDYIIAGKLTEDITDTNVITGFKQMLERPFFGHSLTITNSELNKLLPVSFHASKDVSIRKGRFPLVIATAKPESYAETFEFLAAHGFVVAAVTMLWKDEKNDTLLYVNATNALAELLRFELKQPYVDTNNISAFGHGGGIQPAFYLAMRTSKIKSVINLDGGVFGLRSKTTLSPDYNPARLKIPMLHIITQSQRRIDNPAEFNALSNLRYRLIIKSDSIRHHDFTIWGRVITNQLRQRGEPTILVNKVFTSIDQLILYFLKSKKLISSVVPEDLFQYEKF
jgi:hypothetical protein